MGYFLRDYSAANGVALSSLQVIRHPSKQGELHVKYFPAGDEHTLSATYNGAKIPGLDFTLKPRALYTIFS